MVSNCLLKKLRLKFLHVRSFFAQSLFELIRTKRNHSARNNHLTLPRYLDKPINLPEDHLRGAAIWRIVEAVSEMEIDRYLLQNNALKDVFTPVCKVPSGQISSPLSIRFLDNYFLNTGKI